MHKFKGFMVLTNSVFNMVIGPPGSGKSCYAGRIVRECRKKKIKVFSNYPVRGAFKLYTDEILTLDTHDSVVIIDEAGGEYNSRNSAKFSQDLFRFYATARHRRTQVFFLVQNWQRLDVALRELATTVLYLTKSVIPHHSWKRIYHSAVELVVDENGNATDFKPLFKVAGWGSFYPRWKDYKMIDTYYDDHKFEDARYELWDEEIPITTVGARISSWINRIKSKT